MKEIDRQYERNNNADLDNGVYHQPEETKKKETGGPQTDLEKLESLIQMQEADMEEKNAK